MSGSDKHYSGSEDDVKPALLKKKKRQEKPGYKIFDAQDSDNDSPVLYDDRETSRSLKLKKHKPSFKLSAKIKLKDKDKDGTESQYKKVKDKPKGMKKKDKLKVLGFGPRSDKAFSKPAKLPVFGVDLSLAVDRSQTNDGINLPVCVRECIDYIEEHGLLYEGIYRISGVQSKVQHLKDCYNHHQPAHLYEHEPSNVASLLKQFLRELAEPVLTMNLMLQFEEASTVKDSSARIEALRQSITSLPDCNRDLLSWMIVHMTHVIQKETINKMSIQNVSLVLSPTMKISHRVLNALFMFSEELFQHVTIKRYVGPRLQAAASKWSVDLPDTEEQIEEELQRQDKLLAKLHKGLSKSKNTDKEEELWEIQRNVTQLKRKLKLITKTNAAKQLEKARLEHKTDKQEVVRRSVNTAELNFALQTGPLRKQLSRSSQIELTSLQSSRTSTEHLSASSRSLNKRSSLQSQSSSLSKLSGAEISNEISDTASSVNDEEYVQLSTSVPAEKPLLKQIIKLKEETEDPSSMKHSFSQESDVTISGQPAGVSMTSSMNSDTNISVEQASSEIPAIDDLQAKLDQVKVEYGERISPEKEETADMQTEIEVGENEEKLQTPPSTPVQVIAARTPPSTPVQLMPAGQTDNLLVPEKLHQSDNQGERSCDDCKELTVEEEEELRQLIAEEAQLIWEEEELIAISDELRQKIGNERIEIDRLKEEIAEYEELRSITAYGNSSEEVVSSSDESYMSTSDTDPQSDEDAYNGLDTLVARLYQLQNDNEQLESNKKDLLKKIHDERMNCVGTRIQIRLLQQQMLGTGYEQDNITSLI